MKTKLLVLVARLGIAIGSASLAPAAHASQVYLYPPAGNLANG
jgi:hypothetical protein